MNTQSPEAARASFLPASWLASVPDGVQISYDTVPGPGGPIPIRRYAVSETSSILLFFHGGGFVLGSLDEFDGFCAQIANDSGCTVISIGYRLAPEFRFPAALEDAWAALCWISSHAAEFGGSSGMIAVGGDSAGANLAAGVCLRARDQRLYPIALEVLLCPWLDLSDAAEATESFRAFGDGLWLSAASICWFRQHYLPPFTRGDNPECSPLHAPELHGLPPTLIITAEFDVLRDQGRAYAERLRQAGVPIEFQQHPGMLHDFPVLPGLFTEARAVIAQISNALKQRLGPIA